MALSSAVVKNGATALTPTGGTDQTFTPDGQKIDNGIHVADAAQADFRIRDNMSFRSKQPTLNSLGKYSKSKRTVTLVLPRLLADGTTAFNLFRGEIEAHPECAASVEKELRMKGGQIMSGAAFESFWTTGNQA